MGTNYYVVKKVDESIISKKIGIVVSHLKNKEFFEAKEEIDDIERISKNIHIGKSSMGWKFIFNHNDWRYFDQSKESMMEFLRGGHIIDEYGESVSFDDFIQLVRSKQGGMGGDGMYEESHFGFRFSTSTEFF